MSVSLSLTPSHYIWEGTGLIVSKRMRNVLVWSVPRGCAVQEQNGNGKSVKWTTKVHPGWPLNVCVVFDWFWVLLSVCMCVVQMRQNTSLHCAQLTDNNYQFMYSCHMPTEAAVLGTFSLLLTIINIICIFVAGIFVLKVCFLIHWFSVKL